MFVTRTVLWEMHTAWCLDSLQGGYYHTVFLCCRLWIFINVVMGIAQMGLSNFVAKSCSIYSRFNFMEHMSSCPLSIHFLSGRRPGMRTVCTASICNPRSVPRMLLFPIPHLVGWLWIPLSSIPCCCSFGWFVVKRRSSDTPLYGSLCGAEALDFAHSEGPHQQWGVGSFSTRFVIFCFYHLEMKVWADLSTPVAGGEQMF